MKESLHAFSLCLEVRWILVCYSKINFSTNLSSNQCQDLCGKSTKPLGGLAALAEALACAKELQGDGTIHAHGFLAIANAFQHSTIEDIGKLLVSRMYNLTEAEIVERVINFVEHLQREDHYKHDQHQEQLEQL